MLAQPFGSVARDIGALGTGTELSISEPRWQTTTGGLRGAGPNLSDWR
jgi:hypothetical protein